MIDLVRAVGCLQKARALGSVPNRERYLRSKSLPASLKVSTQFLRNDQLPNRDYAVVQSSRFNVQRIRGPKVGIRIHRYPFNFEQAKPLNVELLN